MQTKFFAQKIASSDWKGEFSKTVDKEIQARLE